MPRFTEGMQEAKSRSNYYFTHVPMKELGASEYTLGTLVIDISTSVAPFATRIEAMLKTVVRACKRLPRSENMLLRIILFNKGVQELHGFKILSEIDVEDYNGTINPNGATNLFGAMADAIDITGSFGASLRSDDYTVDAVMYLITDGGDTERQDCATGIRKRISQVKQDRKLASFQTYLIGVNLEGEGIRENLEKIVRIAEMDSFLDIGDATEDNLTRLGVAVSSHLSSLSKSLLEGTKPESLTF